MQHEPKSTQFTQFTPINALINIINIAIYNIDGGRVLLFLQSVTIFTYSFFTLFSLFLTVFLLSLEFNNHKMEFIALISQIFTVVSALYISLCYRLPNQELFSFLRENFLAYQGESILISETHAGTFLSIIATIFMIYAALWALLSNLSSEHYAGIYYNEYFLSMKPYIYKQKSVLLGSLFMLFLSCVCYIYGMYTLIEAMLFCEMICIAISSIFVYDIFIGDKKNMNEEIWRYSLVGQTKSTNL